MKLIIIIINIIEKNLNNFKYFADLYNTSHFTNEVTARLEV